MIYDRELIFVKKALAKYDMHTNIIDPEADFIQEIDGGLRKKLGVDIENFSPMKDFAKEMKDKTVYRYADAFLCNYIMMKIPEDNGVLIIGPYTDSEISRELLLEFCEYLDISPKKLDDLEDYYSRVPVLSDNRFFFGILDSLAEMIYGSSENYVMVDAAGADEEVSLSSYEKDEEDPEERIIKIEKRYENESNLMKAVEQGQEHKAEYFFSRFSASVFEKRLSDPLRNIKNYCIIMNTLLRKAAQNGGVHPLYIDKVSSDFARKIETVPNTNSVRELMIDMFKGYCKLVRKHATKDYSPHVQKVILYIASDLTADLSLSRLAEEEGVSPSYLSTIFKNETGQTVTEFVNSKRIKYAKKLLTTTSLQIQTVAQYCGFYDMYYFSRVFKKTVGVTPNKYRSDNKKK